MSSLGLKGQKSINTSTVSTSIASSTKLNVAALHGEDNKKVGEEL